VNRDGPTIWGAPARPTTACVVGGVEVGPRQPRMTSVRVMSVGSVVVESSMVSVDKAWVEETGECESRGTAGAIFDDECVGMRNSTHSVGTPWRIWRKHSFTAQ